MSLLASTLFKLLVPAAAIVVALTVYRRRQPTWRADLGLGPPRPAVLAGWLAGWLVWIAISEAIINSFGLSQAKAWPDYPLGIVILRILALGVTGPILEEVVVRGILLDRLRRTRLQWGGAIAVTAVAWAAVHVQYDPASLALITVDGIILGVARWRGGSLWIPIAMHVVGNLISVGQSLTQ